MPACDVLVIGAGPAGSVAAALLARDGLTVRLVDKKPFPRRKVCGACLSGYAVSALEAAGLGRCLLDQGAPPLASFRLASSGRSATVPLRRGYVLSRSSLDVALAAEAVSAGATFDDGLTAEVGPAAHDHRPVALRRSTSGPASADEIVHPKVVLVAAGLAGAALRHDPELRSTPAPTARIGAGAESPDAPDFYTPGTIFMATGRPGYVGLVRTETGTLNVAAALDPRFVTAEGGLGPAAAALVRRAGFPHSGLTDLDWSGTPSLTRRPSALAADRVFLVGDAAGYVEPFTGEGIGWAIGGAVAVAPFVRRAVEQWSTPIAADWTATHARTIGRRQRLCRVIAAGLRSPAAVGAATRLLRPFPWAASPVLRHLSAT